jgi:ubiquinone/menaquinone biosynthesis C-methylase UbiE
MMLKNKKYHFENCRRRMMENSFLEQYYNLYDEDGRLASKHGKVEFITTMKYIHDYVKPGAKVLEVGAGTGRYSIALSREGYQVQAMELIEHNIEVFKSKLMDNEHIDIKQGNALDLSVYDNNSFDAVLILGPMYHLYNEEDKVQVLKEAKRILKKDGYIFVAYCMNEPTIIQWAFADDGNNMLESLSNNMLTDDFACISKPADLFELVRVEDIERLSEKCELTRIKFIGTDMFSNYIKERIEEWSDEVYEIYLKYHFSICERSDVIGLSNHTLDILVK